MQIFRSLLFVLAWPRVRACVRTGLLLAALAIAGVATQSATAAPGIYDPGFGTGGVVTRNIGPGYDLARAVALQPDGKIVVVGSCGKTAGSGSARDWCITRLNASGSIDNGFATNGLVQLTAATDQYPSGVAVAADGNIIVTGTCEAKFCAYRISSSGGVYTNFGDLNPSGGRALFGPSGLMLEARTMLLQPDGRIIVGGACYNGASLESVCIGRFNANGSIDTTFGPTAGAGVQFGFFSGQIYRLGGLALQSDGQIVYAGSLNPGGQFYFTRGRFNSNGTFDGGFMTSVIAPPGSSNSLATSVAIQADGKVLLGGFCTVSSTQRFCVVRVLGSDGSIDTTYGSNGIYIAPIGVLGGGAGESVVVQPDGKAILSGTWSGNFSAIRLNEDGSLDTTWAGTGYTYGSLNGGDRLYASALQRDGKLLWIGQCTLASTDPAFCVQRVDSGPLGAGACSLDVDDDGRVLGTADMLILSRVQRGVAGAAIIGGLTFSSAATRNTWPLIRQFLIAQCGLTVKD